MVDQRAVSRSERRSRKRRVSRGYRAILLPTLVALIGMGPGAVRAADVALEHVAARTGRSVGYPTGDTSGEVIAVTLSPERPPRLLRALGDRVQLELGAGGYFHADPSGGPVGLVQAAMSWHHRLPAMHPTAFLEFGSGITLHEEEHIEGRKMGGRFFFTTQVTIGRWLSRTREARLGLRVQHTSNAGITEPNPGLDVIMLELAFPL